MIRRPGRAMAADLMPALPSLGRPVEHHVCDARPALAAGMETGHRAVPKDLIGTKRPHVPQPDPLPFGHVALRLLASRLLESL